MRMPGALAGTEPGVAGMHRTDSIDYGFVGSGEVAWELDDGEQTVLRAGDVAIRNGARHAWRHHSTETRTIVGADRARPVCLRLQADVARALYRLR